MVKLWKLKPILKELDEMVGMQRLKDEIVYLIMYYLQGLHLNYNSDEEVIEGEGEMLHTVLIGKPGTGKTTVAYILAKIYTQLGFLSKGHVIKADKSDFVGKYVGHSESKTKKLLEDCEGGVLFIDEAYSLSDDCVFSRNAVNILNSTLTEKKNNFICIIAGYREHLDKHFFAINDGLKRRFPWTFEIDAYTSEELVEIFKRMVLKNKWKLNEQNIPDIIQLFKDNKKLFEYAGGDIEVLFSKCKIVHTHRLFSLPTKKERKIINKEDVNNAINLMKKNKITPKADNMADSKLMMYS